MEREAERERESDYRHLQPSAMVTGKVLWRNDYFSNFELNKIIRFLNIGGNVINI